MADGDADRIRATGEREQREVQQHTGGHGHSVAAWAAVGTVMVGSLVLALAVVLALVWLFVVGAVVIVVGAVLGKVLYGMGFGERAHEHPHQGAR